MREILESVHDWGMTDNRQTREDKATFDIQWAPIRLDGWEDTILDWTSVIIIPVFLKSCSPSYFFIPLPRHFFHCCLCHPRGLWSPTKKRFSATYFATIFKSFLFSTVSFPLKVPAFAISFAPSFLFVKFFFSPMWSKAVVIDPQFLKMTEGDSRWLFCLWFVVDIWTRSPL